MKHFQSSHVCQFQTSPVDRLTQQTLNHMPRLDCPSVSAETQKPWKARVSVTATGKAEDEAPWLYI